MVNHCFAHTILLIKNFLELPTVDLVVVIVVNLSDDNSFPAVVVAVAAVAAVAAVVDTTVAVRKYQH
jgi:hypothetical protein